MPLRKTLAFTREMAMSTSQHQQRQPVGDHPFGQEEGHDIQQGKEDLCPGVQPVDEGIAGKYWPRVMSFSAIYPPFPAEPPAGPLWPAPRCRPPGRCPHPRARSRAKTRVMAGTPGPWPPVPPRGQKTSRGCPTRGCLPWLTTASRSTEPGHLLHGVGDDDHRGPVGPAIVLDVGQDAGRPPPGPGRRWARPK